MTDAIALLAISQIVCLGGIAYLYVQLQAVRGQLPRLRSAAASRVQRAVAEDHTPSAPRSATVRPGSPAARTAPAAAPAPRPLNAATIAARMDELGVDVAALARRTGRSEEEVRLMLRRQGMSR
ncbi:MAG: hypothetical protein HY875_09380 [Chloroflexi bacterium]|nr:hypothetical protein [Chloroflexota bacterium]